jgi:hypothetical protein
MASTPQFGATAVFVYNTTAITAANTTADGTSGTITFLQTNTAGTAADWVAGTTGAFIDYIKIAPLGTNVATVMRVWSNANATNATAANNHLIEEATCPASTVSQVAALAPVVISVKRWFPAGTKFFVTIGTAVAAGFDVTAYGSQM